MDQYERNKQMAERIQRLRGYETDIPPDMQELWIPPEVKKRYRYKTGRARGYYRDGEKRRFIPRRETWEERGATTMRQRANAEARRILAEHHPEYVSEEQAAEIDRIARAAQKDQEAKRSSQCSYPNVG